LNIQTNCSIFNIQNNFKKFQPAFGDKVVKFPGIENNTNEETKIPSAQDIKPKTIDGHLSWIDSALSQLTQTTDIRTKQKASNEIHRQFEDLLCTYEIYNVIKDAYDTGNEKKLEEFFDKSRDLIENLSKRQKNCEAMETVIDTLEDEYIEGELPKQGFEDIYNMGNIVDIKEDNLNNFFIEEAPIDKNATFTFDIKLSDFDKPKILENMKFILDKIESLLKGQS